VRTHHIAQNVQLFSAQNDAKKQISVKGEKAEQGSQKGPLT
jgi:hypothetical protein